MKKLLTKRVELLVKLVKTLKYIMCMHVHGIQGQIVRCEFVRLEHLAQGHWLSILGSDNVVRVVTQLALDEFQQVLLVHAARVVHMGVDLVYVVNVAVRDGFLGGELFLGVQHRVQVKFGSQKRLAGMRVSLHSACVNGLADKLVIIDKGLKGRNAKAVHAIRRFLVGSHTENSIDKSN